MIFSSVGVPDVRNAPVMKLLLSHQVLQSIMVSNVASLSKCVAKSTPEYICVITRFVPSPVVRYIPVLVLIVCPIL